MWQGTVPVALKTLKNLDPTNVAEFIRESAVLQYVGCDYYSFAVVVVVVVVVAGSVVFVATVVVVAVVDLIDIIYYYLWQSLLCNLLAFFSLSENCNIPTLCASLAFTRTKISST